MKIPKLTVVGAGPGDPELITIKAIKAIETADVILYDALINEVLLKYASPNAELIFVGKRKGCYAYQQEQINDLIVSRAKSHGHVVRLKGGDPFIFGRGAEEIDFVRQFGIETYMVPGISSALAVPAYQGIPLTKRGAAESFWVITGTTKAHKISADVALAAKSTATVVILMGMGKLKEIVEIFASEGKQDVPVAIIQNGTTKNEKFGIGTVSTICDVVEKQNLSNPAIIVIGEVVNQRVQLNSITNEIVANMNNDKNIISHLVPPSGAEGAERNNLYPIFLRLHKIQTLIVGGGNVALEKLTFLLKSSPNANVIMVAPFFKKEVKQIAKQFNIQLVNMSYEVSFLCDKDLVIAATDNFEVNQQIYLDARERNILINVADTPELCDFYLGGIVTKGHVKIAISTNGKSPTTAKRLRQFFEEVIPEDITDLVENLNSYRKTIKGDFYRKVKALNEITLTLIQK